MPSKPVRLLDKLVAAAKLEPQKKEVNLETGGTVVFYVTPLTAAERERAQKNARSERAHAFAIQLLVAKAKDEHGLPIFTAGDVATLEREVRDSDLQNLMLTVMGTDDEVEEALDMKSSAEGAE